MDNIVRDKNVLVIGSGNDLPGRAMGKLIDSGRRWPVVVRCNKPYGRAQDVGSKMDILAIRYRSWIPKFWGPLPLVPTVAFNEAYNITRGEYESIRAEIGWHHVSCGVLAVAWCLNRGAKSVSVIGFGCIGGWEAKLKIYDNGMKDNNPHYNWEREHLWLRNNATVL